MDSKPVGHDVVPETRHPLVRGFRDLWDGKLAGRRIPGRVDFPIEDLEPWFGHVIIMDVIDGGRDFRYRMIGTGITRFLNRDYSGRFVSECDYGGGRDKVIDTFRRPVVDGTPIFRSGHVIWAGDKTWRTYDSVHCPLASDGETTDMTIGVLYFGTVAVTMPPHVRNPKWGPDPQS